MKLKQIASISMAILMAGSMCSSIGFDKQVTGSDYVISASAAEIIKQGTCGTNLNFTLYATGSLVISGSGTVIKDYALGKAPWYDQRNLIKTVTLPSKLTKIGNYAFYGLNALTQVYGKTMQENYLGDVPQNQNTCFPNTLKTIGECAFDGCRNLRGTCGNAVFFGSPSSRFSTLTIGRAAFINCEKIGKVKAFGNKLTIGAGVFKNAYELVSVDLDTPQVDIKEYAFHHAHGLKELRIDMNASVIKTAFRDSDFEDYGIALNSTNECEKYAYQTEAFLNRERVQRNLPALRHSEPVHQAAQTISDEWDSYITVPYYFQCLRPNGTSVFTALTDMGIYPKKSAPTGTVYSSESSQSVKDIIAWTPEEAAENLINDQYEGPRVLNAKYTIVGTGVSEFDHSVSYTVNGHKVKYIWHSFLIEPNPNENYIQNGAITLIAR